jgi:EAL domain-containing protein (putative c-di-GMP-specific phosphodiesterase class I)
MYSFIDALAATGHAHRFMIELTEEAFFVKSGFQENVLPRLKALGVRVSIDDFGVGYSSLAALAEITVDEIKIDRSFITEIHKRPRSQTVLKAIESLAAALGMSVIAEGVETFEEVTYLQMATGIRYAQGYYFSRPMFLHQLASGGNDDQCDRFLPAGREVMAARADRVGSRTLFI